jgi:hypothetical protein
VWLFFLFVFFPGYMNEDAIDPLDPTLEQVRTKPICIPTGSSMDASLILECTSSLYRNLITCGYFDYMKTTLSLSSPVTDEQYTPDPLAPYWDFRVVYDIWVEPDVFGASGFGRAEVIVVHASPSKLDSHNLYVQPFVGVFCV